MHSSYWNDSVTQDFLARERQRLLATEQRGEMSIEDEAQLKKVAIIKRRDYSRDRTRRR